MYATGTEQDNQPSNICQLNRKTRTDQLKNSSIRGYHIPVCNKVSFNLCNANMNDVPLCNANTNGVPLCNARTNDVPLCNASTNDVPLCNAFF